MNSDATEPTLGSSPASMRRWMPRKYASDAARYCSHENSSVTLTGTPAKIDSSIASRPACVPGILMNKFGRSACWCSWAATPWPHFQRHFQRHPAVDAVAGVEIGPEQIGRATQVLDRQREEQVLAFLAGRGLVDDGLVVE